MTRHHYDDNLLFDRVILVYGFRPFFILSAGYAAVTVLLWAGFWYDLVAAGQHSGDPVARP